MKKIDLFRLEVGLQAVGAFTGARWAYAVATNRRTVSAETELLRAAQAPSPGFTENEKLRVELCKRHAKKGEDGGPLIVGNVYAIDDRAAFTSELISLQGEHREAIDGRVKLMCGYQELLQEPADIVLHLVERDDLPEKISGAQLSAIFEILGEPEPQATSSKPTAKANGETQPEA